MNWARFEGCLGILSSKTNQRWIKRDLNVDELRDAADVPKGAPEMKNLKYATSDSNRGHP